MLVVAFLDATAELDQVLVVVNHDPFDGLSRLGVVSTLIERDPAPAELVAVADFWPGQPAALRGSTHSIKNLSRPEPGEEAGASMGPAVARAA